MRRKKKPVKQDKFSFPQNTNVIGMIGNICALKGQIVLLRAVSSILLEFPNTIFLVIGNTNNKSDETYKNSLQEYILRSGLEKQVVMAGFRDDIFDLLEKIDILVHPAILPEAFGLVILEAMYKGVPVVASNIGGIPELVHHTVNGLLFPPNDSMALAQAVCRLLRDPQLRTRMGKQGTTICRERFSQKQFIDKFNQTYQELIQVAPFSL
jgi:glycosyltransferase involved in cell wall biosynthesis